MCFFFKDIFVAFSWLYWDRIVKIQTGQLGGESERGQHDGSTWPRAGFEPGPRSIRRATGAPPFEMSVGEVKLASRRTHRASDTHGWR